MYLSPSFPGSDDGFSDYSSCLLSLYHLTSDSLALTSAQIYRLQISTGSATGFLSESSQKEVDTLLPRPNICNLSDIDEIRMNDALKKNSMAIAEADWDHHFTSHKTHLYPAQTTRADLVLRKRNAFKILGGLGPPEIGSWLHLWLANT